MLKFIEWVGTVASVAGSFVVAQRMFTLGYALFLIGSVCWLVVGFRMKNKPLMALNGAFLTANLLGMYNAFP